MSLTSCLITLSVVVTFLGSAAHAAATFRAAVYEYTPICQPDPTVTLSRKDALDIMRQNIAVFDKQARVAYRNNTKIIVFPENALYGYDITRDTIKPYLEVVPDPEWERQPWSPCMEPDRYVNKGDIEALRLLSCIAWDYEMYVVANMGSKEPCDSLSDPYCPTDGQFQFNTNVVFNPNGVLIARYRKYYLYWQPQFNRPSRQEVITFKTDFGTFGTFASGDIFYKRPAVDLVKRCKVTSIVAPMTWDNTFPFPLAIEVQQGFAVSMGVNLMVANTLEPRYKIGGSGIYSSTGAIRYTYNRHSYAGKLIIADLPVVPTKPPDLPQKKLRKKISAEKTIITRMISGNEMRFTPVIKLVGRMKICHKGFCCNLQYNIDRTRGIEDMFVLGVFNGRHTKFIDLQIQVCGLIKCAGKSAKSCGRRTFSSSTIFTRFTLWGTFENTESVFPFVLLNGMSLGSSRFNYSSGMLHANRGFVRPVIDVILFGRNFAGDPTLIPRPVNRTITTAKTTSKPPTTTQEKTSNDQPKPDDRDTAGSSITFALWTTEFILSLTGLNIYMQLDARNR